MNWTLQAPYLEITSQCNLRCRHCYNSSSSENTAQLSRETILTCLEFFSCNGVQDLSISGGEPLLHPDVVDILQDAHERGFRTLLATNGTLLSGELIKHIRPYVTYYQISVDGNKPAHEAVRGPGSYEATFRGVHRLCAEGLQKQTRLRMTISHSNCNSIPYLIEEAAHLGLEAVHFSIIRSQGRANENFEELFQLSDERLIALYHEVRELRRQYKGTLEISRLTVDGGECTLLKKEAVIRPRIDTNGDIYPCEGYLDPTFRLGTLDEGLPVVFSDERILSYIDRLNQIRSPSTECNNCYWSRFLCLRGCPAEAQRLGNGAGTDGLCGVRKAIWNERIHGQGPSNHR